MIGREQLERLWRSLIALGARRLATLGLVGLVVFATVGLGSYYLSRPQLEVIYTGLSPQDVSRIGAALKEAGIAFDVNSQGTAVLVRYGQTAQARMLLAEKGLPSSASAGYELFDKLGSMGLTSFMQEITRVRALEGEIARTIQVMKGVKAARVHIVLPDTGSFRRSRQPPSASVIVRTESAGDFSSAQAIRHLVAAAVPGLTIDQVTVLEYGRHHPGLRRRVRQRRAGQDGEPGEDRQQGAAGQHRQDARPLPRPRQLRDQRRRPPQHRQAPDQRDGLQPRVAGRALGARRQGDGKPAEQRQSHRRRRRAERSGRAARHERRRPVEAHQRAPRGAHQLRGRHQDHLDRQRGLQDREPHRRRGGQSQAARRGARRQCHAPKPSTSS